MSRILHEFYEEVRGETYLTFNPGTLFGGTFVDYDPLKSSEPPTAKQCRAKSVGRGGLRFISEEQKERGEQRCAPSLMPIFQAPTRPLRLQTVTRPCFPPKATRRYWGLKPSKSRPWLWRSKAMIRTTWCSRYFVCGQPCTGPRRIGKYGDGRAYTQRNGQPKNIQRAHSTHCGVYLPFNPLIFYFFQ